MTQTGGSEEIHVISNELLASLTADQVRKLATKTFCVDLRKLIFITFFLSV